MLFNREKLIWILEDDAEAVLVYQEMLDVRYSLRFFSRISDFELNLPGASNLPVRRLPDLIVADLRLPDGHFLDFLSKSECSTLYGIPYIVVSFCDDIDILRTCFSEGALDFLTKPFTRSELIVKIERFVEGHINQVLGTSEFLEPKDQEDGVVFSPENLSIRKGHDVLAQLTPKELQIFSVLHRARGKRVSRNDIQLQVWRGICVTNKTFDVHLFNLRRKLMRTGLEIRFYNPDGYVLSGNRMNTESALAPSVI